MNLWQSLIQSHDIGTEFRWIYFVIAFIIALIFIWFLKHLIPKLTELNGRLDTQ